MPSSRWMFAFANQYSLAMPSLFLDVRALRDRHHYDGEARRTARRARRKRASLQGVQPRRAPPRIEPCRRANVFIAAQEPCSVRTAF